MHSVVAQDFTSTQFPARAFDALVKSQKSASPLVQHLRSVDSKTQLSPHLDPTLKDSLDRSVLPTNIQRFEIRPFTKEQVKEFLKTKQSLQDEEEQEKTAVRLWTLTHGNPRKLVQESLYQ